MIEVNSIMKVLTDRNHPKLGEMLVMSAVKRKAIMVIFTMKSSPTASRQPYSKLASIRKESYRKCYLVLNK
jgi:hypothetical protein